MRENIKVESKDGAFSAYAALPDRPGKLAVVVLQEIFGVNANIRAVVDRIAAAGHAAIAPDLYWRQQPEVQLDPATDREAAVALMKGLKHDESVADAAAALDALRQQVPGLERSAAVGYCYGGAVAFLMGARGITDGGIAYYGTGLHQILEEMAAPGGRLLLHVAVEDHLCPPDAQQAIALAASGAGDRVTVVSYEGVGHAFARDGYSGFNREAADSANTATLEMLETLAG